MELYQLRYFVKVAELEHMTQAAQMLHVSEPALSRVIRQLESELGCKLFLRKGRSIVLTESGNVLLSRSHELMKYVGDISAEVQKVQQTSQPVRLVARAAACLLPDLLAQFHAAEPDVAVSVIQSDNSIIRSQDYDLMINDRTILPPKYSSVLLLDDPFHVLLPKDHPLARQDEFKLEQLDGQNLIGLTPNRFISAILQQAFEDLHIQVHSDFYSDDPLMIRNLVERGLGLAIMPVYALRSSDKRNLRELPIQQPFPSLHLVMSWKPNAYHSQASQKLRQFIADYFQRLRENGIPQW